MEIIVLSCGTEFFPCLVFGMDFFFGTHVSRLRIEAPPLFTVLGKCIYTLCKAENQEIQFSLLCTKPIIDKHNFFYLSMVGSPETDLSAISATVESRRPIYRPSVKSRQVF